MALKGAGYVKLTIQEIYDQLKGNSRMIGGELTIPDFTEDDYEALFEVIVASLAEFIGDNYEFWYTKVARSFHRQKALSRHRHDFYDPQYEKPLAEQTTREQLATLKFYVTRRTYSRYGKK